MKTVLLLFGTRPEAIKMAPVVEALRRGGACHVRVCVSGQHREMLDQVLALMQLVPDHDLDVMAPGQTLEALTARLLEGFSGVLQQARPDLVLVHGDTTTSMAGAMACFYQRIPVGHVEAGLRTGNLQSPWPEEFNRRVVGLVTRLHFAPTPQARHNLLAEGVPAEQVVVTGNTVVDALQATWRRIEGDAALRASLERQFAFLDPAKRLVLVTGHRRENFGDGIRSICEGLRRLAQRSDTQVLYPVHLNPRVRVQVEAVLTGVSNIHLVGPQDYFSFVFLLRRCHLVLTDSGGIQEEAPSFGKPVLVMRDTTERPEAIEAGTARLIGTDPERIAQEAARLLDDEADYARMSSSTNPFGDGTAAEQIAQAVRRYLAA